MEDSNSDGIVLDHFVNEDRGTNCQNVAALGSYMLQFAMQGRVSLQM